MEYVVWTCAPSTSNPSSSSITAACASALSARDHCFCLCWRTCQRRKASHAHVERARSAAAAATVVSGTDGESDPRARNPTTSAFVRAPELEERFTRQLLEA